MKKIEIKISLLIIASVLTTQMFSQDTITIHSDYVREQVNNSVTKDMIKRDELLLISLGGGLAHPTGSFRNVTSSLGGGMAMPGYFANVSATLKLSENFGFNLGYLYQNNKFDEASAKKVYGTGSTSGGNWLIQGGFIGTSFFIKSTSIKNLSLWLNASSGFVRCVSPNITGIPFRNSNGVSTLVSISSTKATSIAFMGGIGFFYKLNKNVGIHLIANYLQTTPEFKGATITPFGFPFTAISYNYYSFEQKITSLNLQLGVSFFVNR